MGLDEHAVLDLVAHDDRRHEREALALASCAGYVQYRVREDALRGAQNGMLADLLAIRLAYDAALLRAFADNHEFVARWRRARPHGADARRLAALARWQLAYEAGYQRRLARALAGQWEGPAAATGTETLETVSAA